MGGDRVKLRKCDTNVLHIERKRLLKRNLGTFVLLKSKFCGTFQRFNAIGGSTELLKNS